MKNKIAAVILSILLLAAGTGIGTAQRADAAGGVGIIMNGQALQTGSSPAYQSGSTVMIPLREAAEVLKYKTSFTSATGTVQLTRVKETIEFKLGSQELVINGKEKQSFTDNAVSRQGRLFVPLSFFSAIGLVTSYDAASNQAEIYSPEVTAGVVTSLLAAGKYEELNKRYLTGAAEQKLTLPQVQQDWEKAALPSGHFLGIKNTTSQQAGKGITIQSVLTFTGAEVMLTLQVDQSGKVTGFTLGAVPASGISTQPVQN
ncbi:hypothetical protein C2I18_25400 [Paenibacillus sp. PK3_47]|uniref:copper amine oxidase N-terminal domain-containing protein n=1 Tax=Paenibacillus sp. PK3_47 TaxID=2072642 RepID=UPI00201D43CD|nr:copper amine oxidase N-terminal domain-containing protein [Paenibacillus sp. PK3_47]UQZ36579.1 hypothetical protein C2I18_25400 [Paenibacillus sp. PK3_47]